MRTSAEFPLALPEWHPGLSVGSAMLDAQRIVLLEIMQSLLADIASAGEQSFRDRLADLLQLAQQHCADEEHQLAHNGFDGLERHCAERQAGLDRLRFVCALQVGGGITRDAACNAAARWLQAHLTDMEAPAAAALRSRRSAAGDEVADLAVPHGHG